MIYNRAEVVEGKYLVGFRIGSSVFKGSYLGWNGRYNVVFHRGKRIFVKELEWKS